MNYLGGAYKLTPAGGYAVEGYDVVTRDADNEIVVLAPAPAVSNPTDGFASDSVAEDANDGQAAEVALPAAGPVGIRLRSGAAYTNDGPEGPVRYEWCMNEQAATSEEASLQGSTSSSSFFVRQV